MRGQRAGEGPIELVHCLGKGTFLGLNCWISYVEGGTGSITGKSRIALAHLFDSARL
jgi:hypothetical protein